MKLYSYFRSSASYRVRIALNLKELPYTVVPVHLLKDGGEQLMPAYRQLSPDALVPALQLQDQSVALTQSLAIIEYLEEVHPEPPLLPIDPLDRAWLRSIALTIACDIHPLNNLRVTRHLREQWQADDDRVNAWVCHWMREGFIALEERALRQGSARHLHGESLTLADVCLVPQLYNAKRFGCSLDDFPTLVGIGAHLSSLTAFASTRPESHLDAPR